MPCKWPFPLTIGAALATCRRHCLVQPGLHIAVTVWNSSDNKREGPLAQHVVALTVLVELPPGYASAPPPAPVRDFDRSRVSFMDEWSFDPEPP